MPRAGGVYTLPAGNPVVTLTVISSGWANTTLSDIATALTGSLPTDGSAAMTGPIKLTDGAVNTPALSWGSETTSGWYRVGVNSFGFSVAATLILGVSNVGVTILGLNGNALTVGTGAVTGTPALAITNTSILNGDSARLVIVAGASSFAIFQTNAANASALITNGPTGAQACLRTLGSNPLVFGVNNTLVGQFNSGGGLTIAPQTGGGGATLILNTRATNTSLQINPGDSASIGIAILDPGANATQFRINTTNSSILLQSAGGTATLSIAHSGGFQTQFATDGGVVLSGAIGGSQGVGSLNAQALNINGVNLYSGLPQTPKAGNYSIALADQNTCISNTGAAAVNTIPANASVAFPIGAAVSWWNNSAGNQSIAITTDSLRWNTPFVTGTRTLASNGFATAVKVAATIWLLTGNGIS